MKTKIALIALLVAAAVSMTVYAGVTTKANCCPSSPCCAPAAACCK